MEATTVGQLLLLVLVAYSAHYVVSGRSLYANETDRLSLLQFKDAISLDPHQAFMSWNNSIHFCNWEGVLCRVKTLPHRVSSLNLTSRGLVGQISPSLGNLSFLHSLALVENTLTGEIPPSLGHLRCLQTLRLRNNMLQGRIPSFANCSKLRVLDVSHNHLVGQFPTELPPVLQVLRVGTNNLTGTIPASVVNITTLTTISCLNNQIKGNIPSEFADLPSLQYLYAGGNQLAGSFPQAILNLSTLIDLDLGLNGLSGDLPPNLCTALHNLQTLFLGGNIFLGGHIPSSLSNASNLYDVDFSGNNFTGLVPTTIGKLTQLSSLNLEKNQLQAHSREEWEFLDSLGNSTDLQMFSVSRNRLSGHVPNSLGVVPEWIGSVKILQQLGLEGNFFTGVIPSSLSNLSQLGELYLSSNQFIGHIPASFGNFSTLQNLDISNNNLHGRVPLEIFKIPTIFQIDFSFNNLDGQLPTDIGNAKQLVHLVLSSNKLSGDIPKTLGDCESLEDIKLDSNIFGGSIPSSLDHITSLKFLNCSSNNITGSIPLSLGNLQHLEKLDLSFNHLQGEVPAKGIFKNATAIRIEGNQGLCGGPSELHMQACVVTPSNSSRNNESLVLKVVIPITSMVLLAMVIFGILIWRGKHKSKSISVPPFATKFPKISFSDLARATAGFSTRNLIGCGRYSSVYRGKLVEDEIEVAIKVFNLETRGAHKSFIAECNVLRNVRHRNLVPILTACSSIDSTGNDFKALVYEFMPRGDLHNLLYSTIDYEGSSDLDLLTMSQRMSIVVDVADAMEYLHHNNQGTMVHCDLKPSNILLDDNMTAHVGDFGLVRFKVGSAMSSLANPSSSSVGLMGTIGYAAPEYAGGGQVSTAADVYSFGVVLLEIFLRRRPTDDMFKDGLSIVKLTEISFPDRVMEIVDPQLVQELELCQETPTALKEKGVRSLLSMLNVGLSCTKPSPHERTNMQEVVANLHGIRDAYLRGN
ncbi:probable LRR receptor-like serine/threonine-protein kinase At3g47570 isoform X2 [Triticum urartu]|uniref:probable LRR receptor-like serine/threonine-protein kinase At3g47570 isoform X2 n=1 Tax=Triticum urartu TaxID=4572 RepID=UPI002044474B|nr:probable LRR receptor-like serine/threonine-protein kinase At3g47570 isoform X2 [Triticum urartu]